MLGITPRAWRAIDDLTEQHEAAAIRLTRSDCGSLEIDLAAGPEPDDTVVWSHHSVVFVDRSAAPAVDHLVLDLRQAQGSRAFFLR